MQEQELIIDILSPGDGKTYPTSGSTITVHYVALVNDGIQVDSSRDRSGPFKFKIGVGQVIKGWEIALMKLCKGDRAWIICPSQYAYGEKGVPPQIPPNSTMQFEVEVLDIQ